MTDKEYQAASAILEDHRKLIAALKVQRWEVVKWTVGINLSLATASALVAKAGGQVFVFACIVTATGLMLLLHYFRRLTNTRNDSLRTEDYLMANGINLLAIKGSLEQTGPYTPFYEKEELWLFPSALVVSTIPTAFLLDRPSDVIVPLILIVLLILSLLPAVWRRIERLCTYT